jgi:hypothetical protein
LNFFYFTDKGDKKNPDTKQLSTVKEKEAAKAPTTKTPRSTRGKTPSTYPTTPLPASSAKKRHGKTTKSTAKKPKLEEEFKTDASPLQHNTSKKNRTSKSDADTILALVERHCKETDLLQKEIADLKSKNAVLNEKVEGLKERIEQYKDDLAYYRPKPPLMNLPGPLVTNFPLLNN